MTPCTATAPLVGVSCANATTRPRWRTTRSLRAGRHPLVALLVASQDGRMGASADPDGWCRRAGVGAGGDRPRPPCRRPCSWPDTLDGKVAVVTGATPSAGRPPALARPAPTSSAWTSPVR